MSMPSNRSPFSALHSRHRFQSVARSGSKLGEDQLDVKEPLTVVDEVQEISVLLGLADHLDGVRVLEALVVAERLEE